MDSKNLALIFGSSVMQIWYCLSGTRFWPSSEHWATNWDARDWNDDIWL